MKTSTSVNAKAKFVQIVNDIYSTAESCGMSHENILEELKNRVFNNEQFKRCPQWVKSAISERCDCRREFIFKERLIWLFPQENGPPLTWDEMSDEQRSKFHGDKSGEHYWMLPLYNGGKKGIIKTLESKRRAFITNFKITESTF